MISGNEDARLDAEDEAQEAAIRKAFLVEEYKRRKELEAMRVNTLPEEIKRIWGQQINAY